MRLALVLLIAASASAQTVQVEPWGKTPEGTHVQLYTLVNAKGGEVRIATYGGSVVSLKVPDKAGKLGDVVLGFDSLEGYLGEHPYFGALIGRYGNRIAKGRFTLDGETHWLATNNGPNALHGGLQGFNRQVWTAAPFDAEDGIGLALTYVSEDGEEGYSGTLTAQVRYTWTADNTLRIEYAATTDAPTVKNLTNHSYFNLKDAGTTDALGHEVQIFGDHYTPVDSTLIPTGEIAPVEGTPFDFREPTAIGARINQRNTQLGHGGGYDHNHVLSRRTKGRPRAGRARPRTDVRPYDGGLDDGTGRPVLLGKFPGWHCDRKGRHEVSETGGVLPRDAALPRFAESRGVP